MIYSLKMEPIKVQIPLVSKESEHVRHISEQWGFERRSQNDSDQFVLEFDKGRLQLRNCFEPRYGPIYVDFTSGARLFRRKFGGGRNETIAKAIGLKRGVTPYVVDATAGLGQDAFVFACLGCGVQMIERSPVVAALLEDGLNRAKADPEIGDWVSERMTMNFRDSRNALSDLGIQPDVVYLDPMYPQRPKAALVKKEMQAFQALLGNDTDADELFHKALKSAKNRVVVKRPAYADCLANRTPSMSIKMRKNRFDVYLTRK